MHLYKTPFSQTFVVSCHMISHMVKSSYRQKDGVLMTNHRAFNPKPASIRWDWVAWQHWLNAWQNIHNIIRLPCSNTIKCVCMYLIFDIKTCWRLTSVSENIFSLYYEHLGRKDFTLRTNVHAFAKWRFQIQSSHTVKKKTLKTVFHLQHTGVHILGQHTFNFQHSGSDLSHMTTLSMSVNPNPHFSFK